MMLLVNAQHLRSCNLKRHFVHLTKLITAASDNSGQLIAQTVDMTMT